MLKDCPISSRCLCGKRSFNDRAERIFCPHPLPPLPCSFKFQASSVKKWSNWSSGIVFDKVLSCFRLVIGIRDFRNFRNRAGLDPQLRELYGFGLAATNIHRPLDDSPDPFLTMNLRTVIPDLTCASGRNHDFRESDRLEMRNNRKMISNEQMCCNCEALMFTERAQDL